MKHYKTGERVLVKTRVGRKHVQFVGLFQAMHTKTRAVVFVDPVKADDDGMRLVEMKSIAPYYNDPTDQQRRAKHAARLYRQGIRMFRHAKPCGKTFVVETLDVEQGIAVGRFFKRKTVIVVPTHELWPELKPCTS